jgi:hypothetical protein
MGEKSLEDRIKEDITDCALDIFNSAYFSYEVDKDVLIATEYADDGTELGKYAVSITIDLDKING